MEPIVNGLEAEFGDVMEFRSLNAYDDANLELQASYGMRGHPTMGIVDGHGELTASFIGPQDVEVLRGAITAVLDN